MDAIKRLWRRYRAKRGRLILFDIGVVVLVFWWLIFGDGQLPETTRVVGGGAG